MAHPQDKVTINVEASAVPVGGYELFAADMVVEVFEAKFSRRTRAKFLRVATGWIRIAERRPRRPRSPWFQPASIRRGAGFP